MELPDFLDETLYTDAFSALGNVAYAGYTTFSIRKPAGAPVYGSEFFIEDGNRWITWQPLSRELSVSDILRLNPYTSKLSGVGVLCSSSYYPTVSEEILAIIKESSIERDIIFPRVIPFFRKKELPYVYHLVYSPSHGLFTEQNSPIQSAFSVPHGREFRISVVKDSSVPSLDLLQTTDGFFFSDSLARRILKQFPDVQFDPIVYPVD